VGLDRFIFTLVLNKIFVPLCASSWGQTSFEFPACGKPRTLYAKRSCFTWNNDLIRYLQLVPTFLTALANFLDCLEMRKQRQAAYMPDIFVKDAFRNFYGYDTDDTFKRFRYEISKESLQEKKSKC